MACVDPFATAVTAASLCLHVGEDAFDLHITLGDLNLDDANLIAAANEVESFAAQSFLVAMAELPYDQRVEAAHRAYQLFAHPKPDLRLI